MIVMDLLKHVHNAVYRHINIPSILQCLVFFNVVYGMYLCLRKNKWYFITVSDNYKCAHLFPRLIS